jgi:tetratricopeptide (TPR) repeat protein
MRPPPLRVFISYAHRDRRDCEELLAHLSGLMEDGTLDLWFDERISGGREWEGEIRRRLQESDLVLLLVSHWFRASRSCRDEVDVALALAHEGRCRVVPILIQQVDYSTAPYAHLQFLPGDGPVPAAAGDARNEAFTRITKQLRAIAAEIRSSPSSRKGDAAPAGDRMREAERLNAIALRLADQGLPREALELLDKAIELCRSEKGERSEELAALLGNRGMARLDLGHLDAALEDLERAREISEEFLGAEHPDVALLLAQLGGVFLERGNAEAARPLLERALATLEVREASLHPDLLLTLVYLGGALETQPRRAKELLDRVLAADPKDLRAVAAAHSTLGRLAYREGRFHEARKHFAEALKADEEVYEREHPFVAIDLHNLGLSLQALHCPDPARAFLKRALDVLVRRLGTGSPRAALVENALTPLTTASA